VVEVVVLGWLALLGERNRSQPPTPTIATKPIMLAIVAARCSVQMPIEVRCNSPV